MTRLHLYPGWLDRTGGRALLVSVGAAGATDPTVEAVVSGQAFPCLVGPPPAVEPHKAPEGALAPALAGQHSVRIHQVRIPGPLHERVRLVARLGEARAALDVTPLPSTPDDGVSFALASCYYGYFPQRFGYAEALENAARLGAYGLPPIAFKLLVGDNLYLDVSPDQLERSSSGARSPAATLPMSSDDHGRRATDTYGRRSASRRCSAGTWSKIASSTNRSAVSARTDVVAATDVVAVPSLRASSVAPITSNRSAAGPLLSRTSALHPSAIREAAP